MLVCMSLNLQMPPNPGGPELALNPSTYYPQTYPTNAAPIATPKERR